MKKLNLNKQEDLKDYVFQFMKAFIDLSYTYKVDYDVFEQRMSVCKGCEHFNSEKIKCKECGCQLIHKASDALESCPLKKWDMDQESWNKRHFSEIAGAMPVDYIAYETTNE